MDVESAECGVRGEGEHLGEIELLAGYRRACREHASKVSERLTRAEPGHNRYTKRPHWPDRSDRRPAAREPKFVTNDPIGGCRTPLGGAESSPSCSFDDTLRCRDLWHSFLATMRVSLLMI